MLANYQMTSAFLAVCFVSHARLENRGPFGAALLTKQFSSQNYLSPFRSIIKHRRVSEAPWNPSEWILLMRLSLRSSTSRRQQFPRPSTRESPFPCNCSTRMLPSGAAAKLFRLRRQLKLKSSRCREGKIPRNTWQSGYPNPTKICVRCKNTQGSL